MTVTTETLEVIINDSVAMDSCLDAAVNRMIEVALRKGRLGVLVTRLGDNHFTVGLSEAVPFGYTEQLDDRNRSRQGAPDGGATTTKPGCPIPDSATTGAQQPYPSRA